jgi:hypothetical protein
MQVKQMNSDPVLYAALADVVQMRQPFTKLANVLGNSMRQKDVASIATIHHSLGKIDSSAGNVGSFIDIFYLGDRPAVDPHSNLQRGFTPTEPAVDFQRATYRRFRRCEKNERYAIACRQSHKLPGLIGCLKLGAATHNHAQLAHHRLLIVDKQPGIADDIDEQNVRDLQFRTR